MFHKLRVALLSAVVVAPPDAATRHSTKQLADGEPLD
jgi:hypothetical protein